MWKTSIIIMAILLLGSVNSIYAAGLESGNRVTSRERAERNTIFEDRNSFDSMMTGLNLGEDVSAGLVFGLDKEERPHYEGPDNGKKGFGIGFGFGFSF